MEHSISHHTMDGDATSNMATIGVPPYICNFTARSANAISFLLAVRQRNRVDFILEITVVQEQGKNQLFVQLLPPLGDNINLQRTDWRVDRNHQKHRSSENSSSQRDIGAIFRGKDSAAE